MLHIIRFTGLVIVLLFVYHALKCCSVHAHQGGETAGEETVMQKEFHGRKIGRHEVEASKNSGNAELMSIGKYQPNNQVSSVKELQAETSPGNDEPVIGKKVESKRLMEEAKEIVKLMEKDYKGSDRPRRKPPINNRVPMH